MSKLNRSGKKINFDKVLRIKKLRDQGDPLRVIAEKTTLSVTTVVKYLKILESIKMEIAENVS